VGGAVFAAVPGDGGDAPLVVDAHEVEEVGAAVVDFAVDGEVEGGPDYSEVIVDVDDGVVDGFADGGAWGVGGGVADAFGEGFDGELGWFAVVEVDEFGSGDGWGFDGCGVAMAHAFEDGLDGGEDCVVCRRGMCREGDEGDGGQGCEGEGGEHVLAGLSRIHAGNCIANPADLRRKLVCNRQSSLVDSWIYFFLRFGGLLLFLSYGSFQVLG